MPLYSGLGRRAKGTGAVWQDSMPGSQAVQLAGGGLLCRCASNGGNTGKMALQGQVDTLKGESMQPL